MAENALQAATNSNSYSQAMVLMQIYREGKDKERVFDLLTLERKRIESFEAQACWQGCSGPEDLQVGGCCGRSAMG